MAATPQGTETTPENVASGSVPAPRRHGAIRVALLVTALYGVYLLVFFGMRLDARQFIHMYRAPFSRSTASTVIKLDPSFRYTRIGHAYDGQWYYFIALDPANARYYVDWPAYRYTKILYPMLARGLAFGQANLIPYTLIAINWAAVTLGTWALAAWLRRRDVSVWLALPFGLYLGTFDSFTHDLTEPLSYGLLALAIYFLDRGRRRDTAVAALVFALAVLARDKAIIVAGVYVVGVLLGARTGSGETLVGRVRHNFPGALAFGAAIVTPLVALKLYLRWWLQTAPSQAPPATTGGGVPSGGGTSGTLQSVGVQSDAQAAPFSGVLQAIHHPVSVLTQTPSVYAPALVLTVMLAWSVYRRMWSVELLLLAVTLFTSVVILSPVYFVGDYWGVVRVSTAVVLAAILCVPLFRKLDPRYLWLVPCVVGWSVLTPFLAAATLGGT